MRTDQTVACWGQNTHGQADPPEGTFTDVASGNRHSCGLRTDHSVVCWGENYNRRTIPRQGVYAAIAAGRSDLCGIRNNGTVACWGLSDTAQAGPPDGAFVLIAVGDYHACGLSNDHTIACWGSNAAGQADPPEGEFTAITAGSQHSCGLRSDHTIVCWGLNNQGQATAPEGDFIDLDGGEVHTCGQRADHTVTCWGSNYVDQADPPQGGFSTIAAGDNHTCGITTNSTIICWGYDESGQADPPKGEFVAVAAGREHSCGIRNDDTVTCWGANEQSQADPPEGAFASVVAASAYSCGLRADGAIECWGRTFVVPSPVEAQQYASPNQPDPQMCRPPGPAGFPLPIWRLPSLGTIRVAVLFVDFPEAQATHTTHQEADLGLPFVEKYLETVSYGNLDIEFAPLYRWLRAEYNYDHYLTSAGGLNAEAVRLADAEFDFAEHEALMIILPSSHFGDGVAGGVAGTEEGTIWNTTRINAFPLNEPRTPYEWRLVGAHELAHNLGLLDLYPSDQSLRRHPNPPAGKRWVDNQIGLMGMWTFFLASEEDPRLAHDWHYPDGNRSTAYDYHLQAPEMLAWSRWQLGWLDATQVHCVTQLETETTITISPVVFPGSEGAMIAIPVSETEVIVIESRRKLGYDVGEEYVAPNGFQTTFPVLAGEGVLVYTVKASLGGGRLPLQVVGNPDNDYPLLHFADYPLLTGGQSVTVGSYTIAVQATSYYTDTVTITRTAGP